MTESPDRLPESLAFDEAYAELQRAVEALESGGQPLEEAIALHERAAALLARCDQLLSEAELRVRQLVRTPGGGLDAVDVRADQATEADPPGGG
jgi:exodeoxyribonuclease VII small subunit